MPSCVDEHAGAGNYKNHQMVRQWPILWAPAALFILTASENTSTKRKKEDKERKVESCTCGWQGGFAKRISNARERLN